MVGLVYEYIFAEDCLREFLQPLFICSCACGYLTNLVWMQDGPLSRRFGLTKLAELLELEPEAKSA